MTVLLGVDTGGTYTDAVLIRDERDVIASAKSLTTRHDLSVGIGKAIAAVMSGAGVIPDQIGMASLSTTLATNALVEGQGTRGGLICIGFNERDLQAQGLSEALGSDPRLLIAGGHNHAGAETATLDRVLLESWLREHGDVSAFAVVGRFATRNPAHELAVAELIQRITGRPVSCSHHLSAKLNGPKRGLTALLNARLIGMIARLIDKAEETLQHQGIQAPLMVVRGDGALISAAEARTRPIETILSGPAASIVGGCWLTGMDEALVSDIGGTTTDVAVLRNGRPAIDPAGARVGQWRTMVEAVAMRTTGLGGDSEVHMQPGLQGRLWLGPRRVLPTSLIATEASEIVHATLDEQLRNATSGEYDGAFVRIVPGIDTGGLGARDQMILERIGDQVQPLGKVLRTRLEMQALHRLVSRGVVQISGVTPSDAAHALGHLSAWDHKAAIKALELFARQTVGSGKRLAADSMSLAQMIIDQLTHQTSLILLETAYAEDETDFGLPADQLAGHVLTHKGLDHHRGLIQLKTALNVPVIGLGASAPTYYPAVGQRLGCRMILPEHAGVANAIGAVVGRVTIRRSGTVTCPAEGRYRVHLTTGPKDFPDPDTAMTTLETALLEEARAAADTSGAVDISEQISRDIRKARAEAREVFLEAEITVEVSGRPRIASL